MLLLIDNYDSFTFNLVQYFEYLDTEVQIYHHDQISIDEIKSKNPSHLVISPGPKSPAQAGISVEVIKQFYQSIPILGICLGHQCLGYAFGAKIIQAQNIFHGRTSRIFHHKQGLFNQLPNQFSATRYHSLVIDPGSLPSSFSIDAWTEENTIMAISHRNYPVFGLQFHPEAILTNHGLTLLQHFLQITT